MFDVRNVTSTYKYIKEQITDIQDKLYESMFIM